MILQTTRGKLENALAASTSSDFYQPAIDQINEYISKIETYYKARKE